MGLDTGLLQIALVLGLVGVTAAIALLMDYLKSYNDQLRERNIDLAARQQERDRWFGDNPEAFVDKIATLLRGAQALPAPAGAALGGATSRARQRAANYGAAAAPVEPLAEEADQSYEPAEADSLAPTNDLTEKRPRTRARREVTRTESWVSKEELERLAERAARIRARYGTMIGEESSAPESAAMVESSATEASEIEIEAKEAATEAGEAEVKRNDEPTGAQPILASLQTQPAEVDEPLPVHEAFEAEAQIEAVIESGPLTPPLADEPQAYAEPEEPIVIPSSPAQAAMSAAVSWRRTETVEAPGAETQVEASGPEAFEPEPANLHLSAVPSYPAPAPLAESRAAGHEVDLDALFDQTYGSPSWLARNETDGPAASDSVLPTGLFEGGEFGTLMTDAPPFTGVAVSIRINDFAAVKPKLNSVEGAEALNALSNLIRSLLREDRDFAGKAQEDEYVLLFPGEVGDEGQRRLFHLSERLWDFQLRSLGGLALMLSWGGLEVDGQPVPEAVTAARDRLEESRRGRAKPGSTFRSARRAS